MKTVSSLQSQWRVFQVIRHHFLLKKEDDAQANEVEHEDENAEWAEQVLFPTGDVVDAGLAWSQLFEAYLELPNSQATMVLTTAVTGNWFWLPVFSLLSSSFGGPAPAGVGLRCHVGRRHGDRYRHGWQEQSGQCVTVQYCVRYPHVVAVALVCHGEPKDCQ